MIGEAPERRLWTAGILAGGTEGAMRNVAAGKDAGGP